jgi:hypothetical protein
MYVSDARTAAVLVQHAVRRAEGAYSALRLAAKRIGARVVYERGRADGRQAFETVAQAVEGRL